MKKLIFIFIVLMLATPAFALDGKMLYATDVTQSGDNTFTGSNIFNSGLTSEDEVDMSNNPITDLGYIDFNLGNGIPCVEGRLSWHDVDGTLNVCQKGGNVQAQVAQEMLVRGKNTTGGSLANATAVRISGVSGSNPEWGLSNAAAPARAGVIGLATEIIGNNQFGYTTTFGMVRDVDTTGTPFGEVWNDGDRIWAGNTDGGLTNVQPTSSERKIFIGIVFNIDANEGIIWVNPINVSYFNELSGPLLTNKSVPFVNSAGMLVEDPVNFIWNDVTKTLNISNIDISGNLIVEGDIGLEAEMYGEELTIALSAGVWANVVGMTNGVVSDSGMIQNSTDGSITVTIGHIYKLVGSASIENNDGPSEDYHLVPAIGGVDQHKCEEHRSITTQAALASVSISCLLDLSDGDVITMLVNSVGGDDITLEHINWMLFK